MLRPNAGPLPHTSHLADTSISSLLTAMLAYCISYRGSPSTRPARSGAPHDGEGVTHSGRVRWAHAAKDASRQGGVQGWRGLRRPTAGAGATAPRVRAGPAAGHLRWGWRRPQARGGAGGPAGTAADAPAA